MIERRLLCVGGHDSSGRAGVDADREVASELGFVPRCIVTAWTEQEGDRVLAVRPRDPAHWIREALQVLHHEEHVRGVKLGLLAGEAALRSVGELLDACALRGVPVVVDPVLGATSGEAFCDESGLLAWREALLSRPVVLTPNLDEAARLLGRVPTDLERSDPVARLVLASELLALGLSGVVLKGGHGAEDPVLDLSWRSGGEAEWHPHPRQPGTGMRGSGCRHATAVCAGLAEGRELGGAAALAGRLLLSRLTEKRAGPKRPRS